jgi:hypothetical protein
MEMTANDMMAEIRDANLSYLMLAQQMIRADKVTAIFRLGVSADLADLIEGMSNAQILKLAGGNMMLAPLPLRRHRHSVDAHQPQQRPRSGAVARRHPDGRPAC